MTDTSIRFYVPDDAATVHAAALESVRDAGPWLPWCRIDLTLDEISQWIAKQIEARKAGTAFEFAIVDDAGVYLGGCGLNNIHDQDRFANLGDWVRSAAVGRGVAPAAVRAVARWAFANTELERLEIICAVDNERSRRVAEKTAAVAEGVLRSRLYLHDKSHDAHVYSIVRADVSDDVPAD